MNSQYEHFAAVSRVAAVRQVRERQQGADCPAGYLSSLTTSLSQYNANRGLEAFFRTGDDIQARQTLVAQYPIGLFISKGSLYVDMWSLSGATFSITPNTDYHVVVGLDKAAIKATLYVNGVFASESVKTSTVVSYGDNIAIGNAWTSSASYPFLGTMYHVRLFNLMLTAVEASALYNNGDPAGYVLPGWYKRAEEVIDLAPLDNWTLAGNASYNPDTGEFHIISDGSAAGVIPVTSAKQQLYRTDLIYKVKFKAKGSGALSLTNNGRIRSISRGSMFRPDSVTEYTEYVALIAFEGVDQLFFKRGSTGEWYIRDIEISAAGCVAEYLSQNITTSGPGELGAVKITGNNSYTWTGADDATFSKVITTSRTPVFGQWYRIEGVISNYEAGVPSVSADTGFTEYPLPQANGNFSVLVRCKNANASPYSFLFRGGARGTNRLLTIEINSIEPVVERSYDLTASGTPEIVYKLTQLVLASPDLMDDGTGHSRPYIGLYFNSAQPDASYLRVNGKIVADVGSSVPTNRPMVIYYRFNFIPGHFYRLTIRWSLISGNYFIEAFGDWSTDTYTYSGDTKHNIPGSYEYTIPLMKAKEGLVNYYRPTVFFGTSEANSRFSIDEIIIEEYV